METKYPIADILRMRFGVDGKGVRALVLVSGCPLRCRYCANKFTWDGSKEAEKMTAGEVYDVVRADEVFIRASGGGITFGGGEPLLYPGLINGVRSVCDPHMTIFAETSLAIPWENIESVAGIVDEFCVDIKSADAGVYREYTGGDYVLMFDNLRRLLEVKGADAVLVRIPVILGLCSEEDQLSSGEKIRDLGVKRIEYFSYSIPRV